MFSLPNPCDADQAIAIVREYDHAEAARLWACYPPADDSGEFPPLEPPYEPSPEDRRWLAPQSIADELQSWEDHREWCEYTDAINAAGRYGDADLAAAGLPIG